MPRPQPRRSRRAIFVGRRPLGAPADRSGRPSAGPKAGWRTRNKSIFPVADRPDAAQRTRSDVRTQTIACGRRAAWGGSCENGVLGAENSGLSVPESGRTPERHFKTYRASGSQFRHAGVRSPPARVCSPSTLGAPVPCALLQHGLTPDVLHLPERRLLPCAYFLPAQRFRFLDTPRPAAGGSVPTAKPLPVGRFEERIRYRQLHEDGWSKSRDQSPEKFFVPCITNAHMSDLHPFKSVVDRSEQ